MGRSSKEKEDFPPCRYLTGARVSLYIPSYNVAKTLKDCIESVLNQTYPIDEILIIDDGSTDETIDIASQYSVRIVRHNKNLGLAASRNTASRAARNEFVAAWMRASF